jgi:SAM-dependent methyltransferase
MEQIQAPPPAFETFEQCAVFYDRLTAHHDYELWTSVLEGAARRQGLAGSRLLDIACGTGKSFLPLLERGYRVTACDVSQAMLMRATTKCDGRASLHVADMRNLPELGEHDLVTCLDEPLNYLLRKSDVRLAFGSAAGCLARDGIYLFDLNTLYTYRTDFAQDDCYEQDGWFFVWRGEGREDAAPGSKVGLLIEAFAPLPDGNWRRFKSHHVQRHYTNDFVVGELERAGLDCLAVHGQHPDGTLDEELDELRHTKRIYIARPAR